MSDALEVLIVDQSADSTTIELSGSLDAAGTERFMAECHRFLGSEVTHLIVDLRKVSFISSSGVGALLMASEDAEEAGCKATFVALSPEVEAVFEILDLGGMLQVAKSAQEARQRVSAPPEDTEELDRSA